MRKSRSILGIVLVATSLSQAAFAGATPEQQKDREALRSSLARYQFRLKEHMVELRHVQACFDRLDKFVDKYLPPASQLGARDQDYNQVETDMKRGMVADFCTCPGSSTYPHDEWPLLRRRCFKAVLEDDDLVQGGEDLIDKCKDDVGRNGTWKDLADKDRRSWKLIEEEAECFRKELSKGQLSAPKKTTRRDPLFNQPAKPKATPEKEPEAEEAVSLWGKITNILVSKSPTCTTNGTPSTAKKTYDSNGEARYQSDIKSLKARMDRIRKNLLSKLSNAEKVTLAAFATGKIKANSEIARIRNKVFSAIYQQNPSAEDRDLIAMSWTAFGEARGAGSANADDLKGRAEMLAVMKVVQNRLKEAQKEFPKSKVSNLDVTLQNAQFSMWNYNDINWAKALLGTEKISGTITQRVKERVPVKKGSRKTKVVEKTYKVPVHYEADAAQYDRSLIAYRDFKNGAVFSKGFQEEDATHYHTKALKGKVNWSKKKSAMKQLWIECPPPPPSNLDTRVTISLHLFYEDVPWEFKMNRWRKE